METFTICGDIAVYSLELSTVYDDELYVGQPTLAVNEVQLPTDMMKPIPSHISLCPASGRLVYSTFYRYSEDIIQDLLPHK